MTEVIPARGSMSDEQRAAVSRYLETGDTEIADTFLWPGNNFVDKETNARTALRQALLDEVQRRAQGAVLPKTKEWLLPIEFRKRELFTYCCEAYSHIIEQGMSSRHRIALFEEYARSPYSTPNSTTTRPKM